MDNVKSRQPTGSLKISQEVIATLEIDGVASMAESEASSVFSRRLGRKKVGISLSDDFAEIDIAVNLNFGAKIPEVCAAIQNSVKDNVQTMTGMAVSKVNISVEGIAFPREAPPAAAQ